MSKAHEFWELFYAIVSNCKDYFVFKRQNEVANFNIDKPCTKQRVSRTIQFYIASKKQ